MGVPQRTTYFNSKTYVVYSYRTIPCIDVAIWQGFGLQMGNARKYARFYGMRLLPKRQPREM